MTAALNVTGGTVAGGNLDGSTGTLNVSGAYRQVMTFRADDLYGQFAQVETEGRSEATPATAIA